jgi:hypothetical protein
LKRVTCNAGGFLGSRHHKYTNRFCAGPTKNARKLVAGFARGHNIIDDHRMAKLEIPPHRERVTEIFSSLCGV